MTFDLTTWMLVFVRAGAWLAWFPIFSMPNIPVAMRVALGGLVAFLVAPSVGASPTLPPSVSGVVLLLVSEVGVGLLLGFVCRFVFHILEFAGHIVSNEMGLSMASTVNPMQGGRSEVPGAIMFFMGAVIFLSMDLHHFLLLAFQKAYVALPVGGAKLSLGLFDYMVQTTTQLFLIGLLMAAPIIAVSFLVNLMFSVLGRAVPQMNVFVESFSFRVLAGMMVFGASLGLMAQHIANYFNHLPADFLRVASLLGKG